MPEVDAFLFAQSHRLFDEYMLATTQSGKRLRRMLRVAADDERDIDIRIVYDLLEIRSTVRGAEALAVGPSTGSARGVNRM